MVSNDSKTTPEVSAPDARAAKMVLAAHPVASRAKDENAEAQGRSGIVLRRPVTLGERGGRTGRHRGRRRVRRPGVEPRIVNSDRQGRAG